MTNWKIWLHGLAGAFIGGASAALSGAITMPDTFSFTKTGMLNMLRVGGGAGFASAFLYLKQSPIWSTETTTTTLTQTPSTATVEVKEEKQNG